MPKLFNGIEAIMLKKDENQLQSQTTNNYGSLLNKCGIFAGGVAALAAAGIVYYLNASNDEVVTDFGMN